jgi:hypothetical protein
MKTFDLTLIPGINILPLALRLQESSQEMVNPSPIAALLTEEKTPLFPEPQQTAPGL